MTSNATNGPWHVYWVLVFVSMRNHPMERLCSSHHRRINWWSTSVLFALSVGHMWWQHFFSPFAGTDHRSQTGIYSKACTRWLIVKVYVWMSRDYYDFRLRQRKDKEKRDPVVCKQKQRNTKSAPCRDPECDAASLGKCECEGEREGEWKGDKDKRP